MKKKIMKLAVTAVVGVSMLFGTAVSAVGSEQMELQLLKKYNTNENIYLRNKPIAIPKYVQMKETQFRGVWISTIINLDFPSKKGLSQDEFKAEYTALLDNLQSKNFNAVIFQVRPMADAFYQSKLNPWSEYLSGTQGVSPGWDPMKWMIEETHNRGMEFHAWFNPYRVTMASQKSKTKAQQLSQLAANNWARKNPQYVFSYEGKLYLNPGEPAVIKYINDSVMEVVKNYDVDAVHFDDYFYPNATDKTVWYSAEEKKTYDKYGKKFKDRAAWRRNNVDTLIKTIHDSISNNNKISAKSVQFGISPYGIWGHYAKHPAGSLEGTGSMTPITSLSSYDNMFADTRKWVRNNWIDYIVPQLYWTFDEKAAPYGELANWWANTVKGTKTLLYIGQAGYKQMDGSTKNVSWRNTEEISNQIKFNSMYDSIKGSSFFSYRSLFGKDGCNSLTDLLYEQHFGSIALLPSKPWLDHKKTQKPMGLLAQGAGNSVMLLWGDSKDNDSAYYAVYRAESGAAKAPGNIIAKIRRKPGQNNAVFIDTTADAGKSYAYAVTAIDRAQDETEAAAYQYKGSSR